MALSSQFGLLSIDLAIHVTLGVVPGAIIAVGIASLLMYGTKVSIYRAQRLNRESAEASGQAVSSTDHCYGGL
jgi:hypothetical protein